VSPRVLILDANQRSALAATRSLGALGADVFTADTTVQTLAGTSKFSSASLLYPNPAETPLEFLSAISSMTRQHSIDIVMPMTDLSTMLLVQCPEPLPSSVKLACAPAAAYEALTVKSDLIERAKQLGIPTPTTTTIRTREDLREFSLEQKFPFVLKPSRSRYFHDGRIYATQVSIIPSPRELDAIVNSSDWLDHIPGMLQQFIPGTGAGIFALGDGEKVVAWFAHRRLREKPPSGGVSVLCQSMAADPLIKDYSARLLQSTNWFGPAMVEYRIAPDGTPYLMEVNGRFWGSLQLSIDSGMDFPKLLVQLLNGIKLPQSESYVLGRRLRWLLGDIDNLLLQFKNGPLTDGSRIKAIGDFLWTFFDRASRQEIFRWSDARPAIYEMRQWFRALR